MASLLEAFFILIEADTSNLKKASQDIRQQTKHIEKDVTDLDKIASRVGGTFQNLFRQAVNFSAAYFSASTVVTGIKNAADYAANLDKVSQSLKVNITDLDLWGNAVKSAGGTTDAFYSSLKNLDASGNTKTLFQLADQFHGLSSDKAAELGKKLGLDEHTILLLQKGRREVQDIIKRQKELGVVTKQDAEIVHKFNQQWDDTDHAFRSLFTVIGSWILPVITKLGEVFEKVATYLRRHSNLIVGSLIAIAAALTAYVVPALLKTVIAAWPFYLLVIAVTVLAAAFALLYEDILAYTKGQDSLIGRMEKAHPTFKKFIDLFKAVPATLDAIGQGFTEIGKRIDEVSTSIGDFFNSIQKAWGAVKNFFGALDSKEMSVDINKAQVALNAASTNPLAAQTSNSILNNNAVSKNTSVNINSVNVQTQATDAQGIATDMGRGLNLQMRQAINNADDGVAG